MKQTIVYCWYQCSSIIIYLCLIASHNPSTTKVVHPPTCAASVAVDRRERERRDDQVGRVLREETMVVLLPLPWGPVEPLHDWRLSSIWENSAKWKSCFLDSQKLMLLSLQRGCHLQNCGLVCGQVIDFVRNYCVILNSTRNENLSLKYLAGVERSAFLDWGQFFNFLLSDV